MGRTVLQLTTLEDRMVPTGLYPGANDTYVSGLTLTNPAAVSRPNGAPVAVTHDGREFTALGSLPGSTPTLTIFDAGGNVIFETDAFEHSFTGGVRVATGDTTGDGIDDFAVSAGNGGGPRVRVFDGHTFQVVSDVFGIDDPAFRGGSYVSLGDVTGDGVCELITMAGENGGPRVTVLNVRNMFSVANFFAYEPVLRDGGTVSSADVNDDGYCDIITAPGQGGGPRIRVIDGKTLSTTGQVVTFADFFASDPNLRVGVNVTAGELGIPCGASLIVTTARTGDPNSTLISGWNPIGGKLLFQGRIPVNPASIHMGAFAAVAPTSSNGDHPDLYVSVWLPAEEGGDHVYKFSIDGYDFGEWDCAPIVVSPPPVSPPPPPPPAPASDLHLIKIADRATAQTGDTVTYTLTVRNDGPSSATSVLVNDPLTAGLVYLGSSASVGAYDASTGRWTLGDLANGAVGTLTISARVTVPGTLTNTATTSSAVGDPDPADNTSSASITVTSPPPPPPAPSANLHLTKQASDGTVSVGETETYTVTVSNQGPDAAGSVTVNDQLPSGFSLTNVQTTSGAYNAATGVWTVGGLANGASATLTITGTITSTGTITNSAHVTSAVGDPDTADNDASVSVTSYALTQLSANGLFYLVDTPGSGVAIADVSVGIGPVTFSRLVVTLGTGLWSNLNASSIQLKVQGSLPSDPRLGSYTIDSTGTILTVDVINYSITTASEIFRLTADVGGSAVPLQVTSVRAYGHP